MTWVAAGVGVAGAASSVMGANKNSKAQKSAQEQQRQAQAEQLAFQKMQYEHERELTDPARYKFLKEATSDTPYGYEQTASQIKQGYASAAHAPQYNYGTGDSGMAAARTRSLQMGQVSDLAGAYRQGLDRRAQMLSTAAGLGNSLGAGQGVAQAYGGQANMFGANAAMYGNAAQQGWQAAGVALNGLAGYLGSQNTPSAQAAPTGNYGVPVQGAYNNVNFGSVETPMFSPLT